ncbi:MAG: Smr/MutS family protein [Alphaproteobacteria bacterium]
MSRQGRNKSLSRADLKKVFDQQEAKQTQATKPAKSTAVKNTKKPKFGTKPVVTEDPVWRTIKSNSQPLKATETAYNLFRDENPIDPHFPVTSTSVFPEKPVEKPSSKQTGKVSKLPNINTSPTSFEHADWTIGDAVQDRLRFAKLMGGEPKPATTKKNLISNLTAGQLVDMDRSTADKFRRGKLPIEGRLDLHGFTQDQALNQLSRFIELSFRQGKRCLIIVTGKGDPRKGGGVLKRQVPEWLNMSPTREKILAISKAQPKDGGTGALYVLLKRTRY